MRANTRNHSNRNVFAVLTVALTARLLVIWSAVAHHGATWLYTRGLEIGFVANSLLSGHGFSSPFGGETGPTALIAPGYPLLIAGFFKVFGTYAGTSAILIMLAQAGANLATILLMMKLAQSLADARAALFAGVFWACWPPFLWMPTIFWETSFSALMLLGMLLFAQSIHQRPTRLKWFGLGLAAGLASLINMALIITLSGVLLWLAVLSERKQRKGVLVAACLTTLVFSPWPLRNAEAFHAFVPLRTTVGLELWMGNHDGSTGFLEESLFPIYNKSELREYQRIGELQYDREKSALAHAWIQNHPVVFGKLTCLRFLRFWIGTGSRGGSPVFAIGSIATSVFGLLGLWAIYKRHGRSIAALYGIPLLCFPLPYYVTHAEFRYRLVIDPLMTVLAAYWLATLRADASKHQHVESHSTIDPEMKQLVA